LTKLNHLFALVLGLIVTCLALWYSIKDIDLGDSLKIIIDSDWKLLLLALLCYFLHMWLKVFRWSVLLSNEKKVYAKQIDGILVLGYFINNLLPAHLGEFFRMYLAGKLLNYKKVHVLATIIIERVFDFLSVVLLLFLALMFDNNVNEQLIKAGYIIGSAVAVFLMLLLVFSHWTDFFLSFLKKALIILPDTWRVYIMEHLIVAVEGVQVIKNVPTLFYLVINSLIQWLLMGAAIYFSLKSVAIEVPFNVSLVVLAAVVFAIILPAAPGYFGTIQLAFILSLIPYSVPKTEAFAASILFHLLTYLSIMVAGLFYMKRLGYDFHHLKQDAEKLDP
jgi:glycosyltransferase 2 family protein